MRDLQRYGPWALITGASDGIGEAMAHRAAADGLNVVLAARSDDTIRAVADSIERANNVQTQVVAADLSTPKAGLGRRVTVVPGARRSS